MTGDGDAEWVAIGEITAPHGVAGTVRVRLLGAFPERFQPGVQIRLDGEGGRRRLLDVREHRGGLIVDLEWVDSREQAEALRGVRLLVTRGERFALPDDHYYVDDLRGLAVYTNAGRRVGSVRDVIANPANDLLEVESADGATCLVPAVRALMSIDLVQGRVVIRALPGLLPGEDA